jgi:lipopolysaccharide transport system permease protein
VSVSLPQSSPDADLAEIPTAAQIGGVQPEPPVTIIERRPGWKLIDFREVWRFRELLYFLVWRDVKVRYKQTVVGMAWCVLQPLATMLVFTLFIGRLAPQGDTDMPYALYAFLGLVPWTFFANAVASAGSSVIGNQNLIAKVYFPRIFIPLGTVGAGFVDFVIASLVMIPLLAYFHVAPSITILAAIPIVALLVIAAVGMGTLLSALTVAYRDFRHVVPFLVQLWLFATPCIYLPPEALVGSRWSILLPLNPAYGLILNLRASLTGRPLDPVALAVSGCIAVGLLLLGVFYFRRVESSFADIV